MRLYIKVIDDINAVRSQLKEELNVKLTKTMREDLIQELKDKLANLEKELLQTVRCQECAYLREIYKHPMNKKLGKGSVIDRMGWVCIPPLKEEKIHFFDNKDGRCELFEQKKK
jgi:hypothetical protein